MDEYIMANIEREFGPIRIPPKAVDDDVCDCSGEGWRVYGNSLKINLSSMEFTCGRTGKKPNPKAHGGMKESFLGWINDGCPSPKP